MRGESSADRVVLSGHPLEFRLGGGWLRCVAPGAVVFLDGSSSFTSRWQCVVFYRRAVSETRADTMVVTARSRRCHGRKGKVVVATPPAGHSSRHWLLHRITKVSRSRTRQGSFRWSFIRRNDYRPSTLHNNAVVPRPPNTVPPPLNYLPRIPPVCWYPPPCARCCPATNVNFVSAAAPPSPHRPRPDSPLLLSPRANGNISREAKEEAR